MNKGVTENDAILTNSDETRQHRQYIAGGLYPVGADDVDNVVCRVLAPERVDEDAE